MFETFFLSEKADKLVNGNGTLEEIIVCSNEIAASTAQLVVSSNVSCSFLNRYKSKIFSCVHIFLIYFMTQVKANRDSHNRIALIQAKNDVSNATAGLVASAKSCSQIIDEKSEI